MRITLRRKIITLACMAALIPVVVMFILTSVLESRLARSVEGEVENLISDHVSQIAGEAYDQCRSMEMMIATDTERAMKGAVECLKMAGKAALGGKNISYALSSNATYQLPQMFFGGTAVGKIRDPEKHSFPVDGIKEMTGADSTLYQRVNDAGDMLAVASTDIDINGDRKIGFLKEAFGSDGKSNQLIQSVIAGKNFRERSSEQFGTRLNIYSPVKNMSGDVIGMIRVHMTFEAVDHMLKQLSATSVGKSGYIWVVGTKGRYKNKYIMPPEEGADMILTPKGKDLAKSIVLSAMDAGSGKLQNIKYGWNNRENSPEREKYTVYSYFEPWGWVVGAGAYMDDYQGVIHKLTGTMHNLTDMLIFCGVVILFIILVLSFYMSGLIANPVTHMAHIAGLIAQGDIHKARNEIQEIEQVCNNAKNAVRHSENRESLDETGQLYLTIKEMAYNLDSLVGQVQRSGIQVTASATEIAASARQLDETVNSQAAATNQISATSLEISANAGELAGTMDKVNKSAKGAADLAEEGKDGLRSMVRIMDDLSSATDNIIEKLASINEQAVSIVYIVTTITKVADRTNLLSLNAAIEAEKAGEFGQGFSVVADEIRRLADQTSVAALEIEGMISNMREAVDSGVMEIDRFAKEVHHGAGKAAKLGKKLDGIMEMVTDLNPRIQSVNEGMIAQATGAQQISQSMTQLSDSASQTSDSLGEFNRAASQLNEAVHGLQSEVSKFKVS